jgi:hypothetical protein
MLVSVALRLSRKAYINAHIQRTTKNPKTKKPLLKQSFKKIICIRVIAH